MARFDEECAEEEIEVKVGDKIQIYPTVKDEEAITDDDYWVGEVGLCFESPWRVSEGATFQVVKLHSIVKGQKKGRIFIEARMYYLWAQAEELFKRDEAQYAKELEMLEEAKETQAREKIKHEVSPLCAIALQGGKHLRQGVLPLADMYGRAHPRRCHSLGR